MSNVVNVNNFRMTLSSNGKNYSYDMKPGDVLFNRYTGKLISFYLSGRFYVLCADGALEQMKNLINAITFKDIASMITGGGVGWSAGSYHSPKGGNLGAFAGATAGVLIKHLPSIASSSGYYHNGNKVFDGPVIFSI